MVDKDEFFRKVIVLICITLRIETASQTLYRDFEA